MNQKSALVTDSWATSMLSLLSHFPNSLPFPNFHTKQLHSI